MARTKGTVEICGYEFDLDEQGRVRLTDIWKMAMATDGRKPCRYKNRVRARAFLESAEWLAIRGGKNQGTWASVELARDYADYVGLGVEGDLAEGEEVASTKEAFRKFGEKMSEPFAGMEEHARKCDEENRRRCEESERKRKRFEADMEELNRRDAEMNAEEYAGEEWNPDFDPETAGEEWKKGTEYEDDGGPGFGSRRFRPDND
jgi:hypothetical protein